MLNKSLFSAGVLKGCLSYRMDDVLRQVTYRRGFFRGLLRRSNSGSAMWLCPFKELRPHADFGQTVTDLGQEHWEWPSSETRSGISHQG